MADHEVDPARVYVAGPTRSSTPGPECIPGSPTALHKNVAAAFVAMRTGGSPAPGGPVPLIVLHGDRDGRVAPVNVENLVAARLAIRTSHPITDTHVEAMTGGSPAKAILRC